MNSNDQYLYRYTNIASLYEILDRQAITLRDPKSWDDKNDTYYIEEYKKRKGLASVLALCFTKTYETYHHWRVFTSNTVGVRIEFDRSKLIQCVSANGLPIRHGDVDYLPIKKSEPLGKFINDLPFLKRVPFQDEAEYRFIYEDMNARMSTFDVSIDMTCITRIVLSPWLHKNVSKDIEEGIVKRYSFKGKDIFRSTLLENETWKKLAHTAQ